MSDTTTVQNTSTTTDHTNATMVPVPAPAPTPAPKYLNGGQVETIRAALATIHAIVWDMGTSGPLPTTFDKLDMSDIERLCKRAHFELARVEARARNAKLSQIKGDVAKVVETHMGRAQAAKKEFDALSPTLKAFMPKFPTTVSIPVGDLQGTLGTSNPPVMVKLMVELGYKIDGRSVGKDSTAIVLPFTEATASK